MTKGTKLRSTISGFLYVVALFSFLGAVTAESGGSFLDFSDLARLIFCGIAAVCVIIASLVLKSKDTRGKMIKLIVMVVSLVVIITGGFIDRYLDHNTGTLEYTADMYKISEAVAAKFETADGKSIIVDSEINSLCSMAELEIQAAPMSPADNPEDWIYRITFNPSEKVPNGEEIIVSVHEKYVQIGTEYYLPKGDVDFDSIMEWFNGKAAYFFDSK